LWLALGDDYADATRREAGSMTVDWKPGKPTEPGLYLTLEEYADSADVGVRIFDEQLRWSGMGKPKIVLWAPFPYPPGYVVRCKTDPGLVIPVRYG
jgi:hypothetical protein